ncbi:MAG TPA: dockerin type I domain-containing protein, partial [Oscillospiraceae bacterium]|nr:dockerin type I domain-containing protein [Oscillospiraceae bacterium]
MRYRKADTTPEFRDLKGSEASLSARISVLLLCLLLVLLSFGAFFLADGLSGNKEAAAYNDFEAYLDQQGFPESYRPALRVLHAKYPNWKFTASHPVNANGTPMKWSTVMAYEGSLERKNSVPNSYSVAQRSFDKGAYNYKTNSWYASDAGFYYASTEIIAYYLDPRNFLSERDIFQFENLSYNPQIHTRAEIAQSLIGTFMVDGQTVPVVDQNGVSSNMKYPDILVKAAEWSNANPVFLAKRIIQEVGAGGSDSVSGTVSSYPGIYNFYNIGAYAGASPISNGLQYAKYGSAGVNGSLTSTEKNLYLLPWTNPYLAIVGGARWISEGYINAGQNTPYYQKWNIDYNHTYGPWWHQYMGNVIAPAVEGGNVYDAYQRLGQLNKNHEFIIPVIAEMPAEKVPFPTDNRSRNNWLQSITVSSGILKPAFDPEVNTYSVTVAQGVESFTVNASAYLSSCSIKGRGVYNLEHGENTIKVQAVSERGDVRDYYLTVNRSGEPGDPEDKPEANMTSNTLKVDSSYVTNADPQKGQNTVTYLNENLQLPEGYKLVVFVDGKTVTSGVVGTGAKLSLFYKEETESTLDYYLLIYGDASGDGLVNSHDTMAVYRYILGLTQPSDLVKQAMDVNKDSLVNSHDMMGIYRHILELRIIDQNE